MYRTMYALLARLDDGLETILNWLFVGRLQNRLPYWLHQWTYGIMLVAMLAAVVAGFAALMTIPLCWAWYLFCSGYLHWAPLSFWPALGLEILLAYSIPKMIQNEASK